MQNSPTDGVVASYVRRGLLNAMQGLFKSVYDTVLYKDARTEVITVMVDDYSRINEDTITEIIGKLLVAVPDGRDGLDIAIQEVLFDALPETQQIRITAAFVMASATSATFIGVDMGRSPDKSWVRQMFMSQPLITTRAIIPKGSIGG